MADTVSPRSGYGRRPSARSLHPASLKALAQNASIARAAPAVLPPALLARHARASANQMDARSSRSGFHNRDASVLQEDDKEEDWDSCIMEGYLQIRAGKMGDGKHKQKYFRMRDTMLVEYKKESNKGKYGKGSARYPKVRFAEIARPFRVRPTLAAFNSSSPQTHPLVSLEPVQRKVLYGVSLDAPECAKLRTKGDAANSAPPSIRPHRSLARCCSSW